jgi:hypothetical protein
VGYGSNAASSRQVADSPNLDEALGGHLAFTRYSASASAKESKSTHNCCSQRGRAVQLGNAASLTCLL